MWVSQLLQKQQSNHLHKHNNKRMNKTENQKNPFLNKNLLPLFKQKKTQNFTTIALTLITLSFFGLFAINPTITTIARLQKQLSDNQYIDQKLQEKIAALSSLQNQYAQLKADIPVILNALPTKPEAILITALLQGIASQKNITITHLQLFQVELTKIQNEKNMYNSFPFTIEAEGTKDNLTEFLSSLINFQRIASIDNISFGKTKTDTIIHMSLRGETYFKQ